MGQLPLRHTYTRNTSSAAAFNLRLGKLLQQAREEKAMTQNDVAIFMGAPSQSTISRIESGCSNILAHQVLELSRLYGKPVSHFFRH